MKKRKTVYQRMTKKQQQHIRECYDGPPSRITIGRIKAVVQLHRDSADERGNNIGRCWECEALLRRVQI